MKNYMFFGMIKLMKLIRKKKNKTNFIWQSSVEELHIPDIDTFLQNYLHFLKNVYKFPLMCLKK